MNKLGHRVTACMSALVLSVLGVSAQIPSCVLEMPVYADGQTNTSTTGTTGNGTTVPQNYLVFDTNYKVTGVRLYFAKQDIYTGDNGLCNSSLFHLDGYKKYALYEFTDSWYNKAEKHLYYWSEANGGGEAEVPDNQILGGAESSDNVNYESSAFSFSELCSKFTTSLMWTYGTNAEGKLAVNKLSDVSDWANNNLGESLTPEDIDEVCANYKRILGDNYPDDLPKNAEDFSEGKWSIIVEPVLVGNRNQTSRYLAFSNADVYRPQDSVQYNYGSVDGKVYTCGENSLAHRDGTYGLMDSAWNKLVMNSLQHFFCDFVSKFKTNPDGTPMHVHTDDKPMLAGFGVFAQNEELINGGTKASLDRNLTLYSSPLSSDENQTSALQDGLGFNEGKGNTVLIKNIDERITPIVDTPTINTLRSTSWWSDDIKKIQYYKWGSDPVENLKGMQAEAIQADNPEVTKAESFARLIGTPYIEGANAYEGYVLAESYSGTYVTSATDNTLSSFYNSADLSNITVASQKVGMHENKDASGNTINYDHTVGYNFTARALIDGQYPNNKLGTVAEKQVQSWVGNSSNGFSEVKAVNHSFEKTGVGSEIENVIVNGNTVGLENSDIYVKKSSGKVGKAGKDQTVGINVNLLVPDEKVNSYVQTITRNEDGSISYGEKTVSPEYSVYTGNYVTNVQDNSDGYATYVVAIPNTAQNASVSLNNNNADALATLIFNGDYKDISVNTQMGLMQIKSALVNILRDETSICTVLGTGNTQSFALGACADGNGGFEGYSVYIIKDRMSTKAQSVSMSLESHRLNYVFPTLLGDSSGYVIKTVDPTLLNEFSITKTGDYSGSLISDEAKVTDRFNLLEGRYNLLCNGNTSTFFKQIFDKEAVFTKQFTNPESNVTLTHAVNMTRGAFGDSYVASCFSPYNSQVTREFITNTLGLGYGSTGSQTPDGVGTGETKLFKTGSDKFRWACDRTAVVTLNDGTRYNVSPFDDGSPLTSTGYDINENVYRYVTVDRPVGENTSKLISVSKPTGGNPFSYRSYSVEAYDKALSFYPEVAMEAYMYDDTNATLADYSTVQRTYLYVLGEKIRKAKMSGLYGVAVNGVSTNINGNTKSDAVATGSDAKELSQSMGNLQVLYAGGNINLSAQSNFSIDLSGFVLDQIDASEDTNLYSRQGSTDYTGVVTDGTDLKNTWNSGSDYNAKAEFQSWVDEFKGSLAVDVSLQTENGSSVVKNYNGYRASLGRVEGGNVDYVESYALTFQNGTILRDSAYAHLIQAIKDHAGVSATEAETLFEASDIKKSIIDSVESRTDADAQSQAVAGFGGKRWYDEQVRTFVVRYYKCSPIYLKNIVVSDKLDINAGVSQSSMSGLFDRGYYGRWYLTVYLNRALSSMPSLSLYSPQSQNYSADSVLVAKQHIEGADFIISGATTADARR